MDYYIDGNIDSIKIATAPINTPVAETAKPKAASKKPDRKDAETLEFSLLPSSDFLKPVAEGKDVKKKALFIKSGKPAMAHLRDVTKNESGKDIVWFSVEAQNDSSLKCLLLEAKNNRNDVRVFVSSKNGRSGIDFSKATILRFM